ncbi:sigma-54 interaction domain-containing protein [Azotosporobacter soli]|uniref:sigma-54 interaction domain-containing protein n=1 Tax=Azotosporobacter soli TaxID=3055040 RepID=UPI0031FF107B
MQEYVIRIDFIDCLGLGYEIFKITEKNGIDKIAMEVIPGLGMVIKFRCPLESLVKKFVEELRAVAGITAVRFLEQMPYEDREYKLRTILNSVSEGIIAVDEKGDVTHINDVACNIFHCDASKVVGFAAEALLDDSASQIDTLHTGKSYKLQEHRIKNGERKIHVLISCIPVKSDHGQIIGAVYTVQDFHKVKKVIAQVDEKKRLTTFEDIICQSQQMTELIASARTVSKSSSTVLLRGESGTGKELFARAIHADSHRCKAPFIAINCTALSENLLESELFGYEEGSFTGAVKGGKKGLFEQAHGGTLFLDEIGEISHKLQVRLLRVLQEGVIRRVGGEDEISVDVRIVAATHRNLEKMMRAGEFREDLYYRLNVIPLTIFPLRERRADIPLLAQHLIRKICKKLAKPEVHLSHGSVEFLMKQEWPGNVRQLENMLERLINLVDTPEISVQHLRLWGDVANGTRAADAPVSDNKRIQVEIPNDGKWPQLKEIVADVEKKVIQQVLEKYPSSRMAGQALGVSNTTILNKMKIYEL